MNEPKHTPGPWTRKHSGDGKRWLISGPSSVDYLVNLDCEVDSDDKESETAAANAKLIVAAPDADRILRHLMEYIEAGEPLIYLSSLMPDDGYDGATDEQTLADAVRKYFEKAGK